jgi:hypothetical protein
VTSCMVRCWSDARLSIRSRHRCSVSRMASAVLVWCSVTCVSSVWTDARTVSMSFFSSVSIWSMWFCVDVVEIVDSTVITVSVVSMLYSLFGVYEVWSCSLCA